MNDIIAQVDYQSNSKINYSEFLSATINLNNFLDEQKLLAVFNQFDTDNSGEITMLNLKYAMQKFGMDVPEDELRRIIKTHDIDDNGGIDFDEFKDIFTEKKEELENKPKEEENKL